MVTAATSSTLNDLAAVSSSPSTLSGNSAEASRTPFKDVYQNVPPEQSSQNDAGTKQKSSGSKDVGIKKTSSGDGNDKTAVPAILPMNGLVLPKAPLLLSFPALGLAAQNALPEELAQGLQPRLQVMDESAAQPPVLPGASLVVGPGTQVALPRIDTRAFLVHLLKPDSPPNQPQGQTQGMLQRPQSQTPAPQQLARRAEAPLAAVTAKAQDQIDLVKKIAGPEISLPSREFSAAPPLELRSAAFASESSEPVHTSPDIAVHDVQAILPESPKTTHSTEILLHLAGNDQSTAAVRVVERSGTVNVSVHASDPELRTSLRSNLGDLASQLNEQGFRTEVATPVMMAARSDNQQDSRQDGQRSSGQHQQSTQEQRQPQRDQRANSDRWIQELEQEASGNAGTRGDTN